MIEQIIYNYLKETLDVPVYFEKPETVPEQYVLIEKTGSGRLNQIESATFVFQSIADTLEHSAILNETVKKAMNDAIILPEIAESSLNSDYYFPNTTKHEYRYQSVYGLVFY